MPTDVSLLPSLERVFPHQPGLAQCAAQQFERRLLASAGRQTAQLAAGSNQRAAQFIVGSLQLLAHA